MAWAFEESVVDVLTRKAARVAEREGVETLLLAGGVAANSRLREVVRARSPVPVFIPEPVLCTDNAAMIGAAAWRHLDEAVPPESPLDIHPTVKRDPRARPRFPSCTVATCTAERPARTRAGRPPLAALPTNVVYRREAGTAPPIPPCGRRAL